MSQHDLVSA